MYEILPETAIALFFLTLVCLHVVKKNASVALLYGAQSLIIVSLLFNSFLETLSPLLLVVTFLTLLIKGVLAPATILRLIKKNHLTFSASSYLSTPTTLVVLAILTAIGHSSLFFPITRLVGGNERILPLAFSAILIAVFLIIHKKGALSQIIGILSLENSIVFFALFANLEQSAGLQIGIIFDILILLIISIVFMSMLYKHFESLDISHLEHLKD